MDSGKSASSDPLIVLIKSSLSGNGATTFGHLVLYTSFGVVRGRPGFAFIQGLLNHGGERPEIELPPEVIELSDVSVEHYSNHLPTASFERLYLRLDDVQGFAIVGPAG
ncbi:MAG TPA: hypothetical protein VKM94_25055 [Blastocatellia bacterium]|nr:hypothetical protein [Blastocatellia bacterium]